MNRRTNERIPMKLPCLLSFSGDFDAVIPGCTANMHRDGILLLCNTASLPANLPALGSACHVYVELPHNPQFTQKCIVCDASLIRIENLTSNETQFAVRIASVAFEDVGLKAVHFSPVKDQTAVLPV